MSTIAADIKRTLVEAVEERMKDDGLTVTELAKRTNTQRQAIRRILDKKNTSITLNTLVRTTSALGLRLSIAVEPAPVSELEKIAKQLPGATGRKAKRARRALVQAVSPLRRLRERTLVSTFLTSKQTAVGKEV